MSKKLSSLFLLTLVIFSSLELSARTNANQVEFIAGSQEEMNLYILGSDLEIDLAAQTPSLRMLMDVEPLLVLSSFPQSFKIKTYSFTTGGAKEIHSTISHTVTRKNRSKLKFTVDLGYVEGDQDFYFEFYDSADRLVNTYRQTIDFSNIQEQVANSTSITAADCDNSSFSECHLDYIMDKINFLLEPKNTNYSNKIKNANGSYNVVLSIPKSVEEQILKGNFNIQPSALETLSRKSNADDLGNHTAYMTLDLDKNAIINVSNISAAKFNGLELDIKGLANFQSGIRIPEGAAEGYILSSDADGNASWQALSVVMNGDNLGTHQASQDLDMQGHNISNADLLQVETVVVNGAFALKAGAGEGFVLSSDAAGNASWQPLIRADVNGDDLGDHIASQDLDLNGNDIVSVNEISADVLRTNVLDVTTVDTGAQIHSPTLKGLIDLEGTTSIIGSVNYAMPSINGSNLINIDWLAANFHEITLNGDVSLNFSNAPANTAELTLIVNQDETGSRTISYPDAIKWPTGMAPVLSSSANAIDIIDCLYNANSTDYLCSLRKADYQ